MTTVVIPAASKASVLSQISWLVSAISAMFFHFQTGEEVTARNTTPLRHL